MRQVFFLVTLLLAVASRVGAADPMPATPDAWQTAVNAQLIDYYENEEATDVHPLPLSGVVTGWCPDARAIAALADQTASSTGQPFPLAAGHARARLQQALTVEMAAAVRANDIPRAQWLRAQLDLPRGVSSSEGALLLQSLSADKHDESVRLLVREAVTWQNTRVRVLLDEALRSTQLPIQLPGRLSERLAEAQTLADMPDALAKLGGITPLPATQSGAPILAIVGEKWSDTGGSVETFRRALEARLPSLLSDNERQRRERLLLKLVQLVPKEYSAGVRDGQISVPLEYREAVSFTQQARQIVGELAPLWLVDEKLALRPHVEQLETQLDAADGLIAKKASPDEVKATLTSAASLLQDKFNITLRRSGSTADIVDEVMAETRSTLAGSLGQALAGNWEEAERMRVEAYTTYDPELESRLMPRDPQLAMDIERLLLDGVEKPGVKVLLDRRSGQAELTEAYEAVNKSLEKATVLLKSGVSPTAAMMNALSIVLREGLEGLLVIVAIFAGLRGSENAQKRRLVWIGVAGSVAVTALTWLLSQTVITSLRSYGEIIETVTGIMAIVVLMLITNWLFQQVYWRQWVTSLKAQAGEGSSAWQLVSVGFLVGYREGFETVIFLQSLMMDAGGRSVSLGVALGSLVLIGLGVAALRIGVKLPYFKILLVTAGMIGIVLFSFVGTTTRAAQTIGWIPVHRMLPGSWPVWMGSWLGVYNTWESIGMQAATVLIVIGTWLGARAKAKAKTKSRRAAMKLQPCVAMNSPMASGCDPTECDAAQQVVPTLRGRPLSTSGSAR